MTDKQNAFGSEERRARPGGSVHTELGKGSEGPRRKVGELHDACKIELLKMRVKRRIADVEVVFEQTRKWRAYHATWIGQ